MEPLSDPLNDRQIKQVKPPPHRPLSKELMWTKYGKPDWILIRDHLKKEGRIYKENFIKLIQDCNKIIENEPNMIKLNDPITVVGDIHGQFYDLIKILELGGNPKNTKYLFLGDFVDRGSFSIEVIILLYAIKINYPETIYFLRGNHECRQMTSFFNFKDECNQKFDQEIYEILMDSFDKFPITCLLNNKFLAVHGGISPELKTLDDIKRIDRFKEPPKFGLFCDLIWSDPVENDEGSCDNIYKSNDVRGCSFFYGFQAVKTFLSNNNLISIIRAHEAQLEGYKMHKWCQADFPMVITIFSAPNYCDVYNNKGAIIKFDNNSLNIQQYNYQPHPYLLPDFMNIFSWSLPFVAEKINEMLYFILEPINSQKEEEDFSDDELCEKGGSQKLNQLINKDKNQLNQKANSLRNKVKFVSKLVKLQKQKREENEKVLNIQGQCPDNKIPSNLLNEQNKDNLFNKALQADRKNDKRPEFGPYMESKGALKPLK